MQIYAMIHPKNNKALGVKRPALGPKGLNSP
jgi:hypothetical protein